MIFFRGSGAGNNFLIADSRNENFPCKDFAYISQLCENVDGLILLQNSSKADFLMRIFNNDGHEAEMCGNGLRCLVKFLNRLGIFKESYSIEVSNQIYFAHHAGDDILVKMPDLKRAPQIIEIENWEVYFLNTGVPHAVIFVDDVEKIDVVEIGRKVRSHNIFKPSGTNVNFAKFDGKEIAIRTYERGVENETLACGTGSVATAIATYMRYKNDLPVGLNLRSGDKIAVSFSENFSDITMCGPAAIEDVVCDALVMH